jgi:hypothetical protein
MMELGFHRPLGVIASEASNQGFLLWPLDCFASLAMTWMGYVVVAIGHVVVAGFPMALSPSLRALAKQSRATTKDWIVSPLSFSP